MRFGHVSYSMTLVASFLQLFSSSALQLALHGVGAGVIYRYDLDG